MYNDNLQQQYNNQGQQPLLGDQYLAQNQQLNYQQNQFQNPQAQNQNQQYVQQYPAVNPQNPLIYFPNGQQILDPSIQYCELSIRKQNICDDNSMRIQNLNILLQMIHQQLQLRFNTIQIDKKSNIYSSKFCEQDIIMPLVQENIHYSEQTIRTGYVARCCGILSQKMKSFSIAIIFLFLVVIGYLVGLNLIYFNNTYSYVNSIGSVNIIYILQICFVIIGLILFLISTFKCHCGLLYVSYLFNIFNQLFVTAEVMCSFIIGFDNSQAYIANLYISFAPIILLLIPSLLIKLVHTYQVKLLVLLGKRNNDVFYKL